MFNKVTVRCPRCGAEISKKFEDMKKENWHYRPYECSVQNCKYDLNGNYLQEFRIKCSTCGFWTESYEGQHDIDYED